MKPLLLAVAGVAGTGLAIFAGISATEDATVRDASGRIIRGGDLGALVMQVGDCFDAPSESQPGRDEEVVAVQGVPCTIPHDAEVFATYELPYDVRPASDKLADDAWFGCYERFEAYVGTSYETSRLDIWNLTPSAEGWDRGDREVVCYVFDYEGAKLTISARNSSL